MTDAQDYAYISDLLRAHSSMVLEPGKEYLVESRLLPLARTAADGSVAGLVAQLQADPNSGLEELVVDAMTITETSWFRDKVPFDALAKRYLPDIAAREKPREVWIWSAGCATGQEVYSLAMTVTDWLREQPMWRATVLGTDRSRKLLERARHGAYSQLEVNRGLPVSALMRYFEREGPHWRICDEVRAVTEFRQLNLAHSFEGMPPMDVVFLRNVLIYFDVPTKRRVLEKVSRVLRPGGLLFLGAGETTLHLSLDFERRDVGGAVCYQVSEGAPV